VAQSQIVSVRGANGLNLYLTATEPGDVGDLVSCQNIDLSVRRAVMPRLGLGRPSSWQGLIYTSAGDLFANEFGANLTGSIVSMCAAGGLLATPPSVAA
jgi:hypothetical protein